jgi:hypothetical protein
MNNQILLFLVETLKSGVSKVKDAHFVTRSISIFGILLVTTTVLGTYAPRRPRQPPRRPPTSLVDRAIALMPVSQGIADSRDELKVG